MEHGLAKPNPDSPTSVTPNCGELLSTRAIPPLYKALGPSSATAGRYRAETNVQQRSRFDPEMWDKRTDGRETVGDTLVMRFTLSRFRLQSLRVRGRGRGDLPSVQKRTTGTVGRSQKTHGLDDIGRRGEVSSRHTSDRGSGQHFPAYKSHPESDPKSAQNALSAAGIDQSSSVKTHRKVSFFPSLPSRNRSVLRCEYAGK